MSTWKAHHGIQKADALHDRKKVVAACLSSGIPEIKSKGKSWQKVEDSTAQMLSALGWPKGLHLIKGLSYYRSIL